MLLPAAGHLGERVQLVSKTIYLPAVLMERLLLSVCWQSGRLRLFAKQVNANAFPWFESTTYRQKLAVLMGGFFFAQKRKG